MKFLIALFLTILIGADVGAAQSKPNFEIFPMYRGARANKEIWIALKVSRPTNELFYCQALGNEGSFTGFCSKDPKFDGDLPGSTVQVPANASAPYKNSVFDYWLINDTSGAVTFCLINYGCKELPTQ